jgi:hypothetical protein
MFKNLKNKFYNIFEFYYDGFKSMTIGKTLWKIIIIKLIIMFAVLKLIFFNNYLDSKFHTEEEKANYVLEQITNPIKKSIER